MNFSCIQLLKILCEMLFEFFKWCYDLLLFLCHNFNVLDIIQFNLGDLIEHLHVFPELKTYQIRKSEQSLVVLRAHKVLLSVVFSHLSLKNQCFLILLKLALLQFVATLVCTIFLLLNLLLRALFRWLAIYFNLSCLQLSTFNLFVHCLSFQILF